MMAATDYGFATPHGDDLISGGDDAITQNANATADQFDKIGPRVMLSINQIRGGLNDAFTIPPGDYTISNSANAAEFLNLPEQIPGILTKRSNAGSPIGYLHYAPHGRDYTYETQTENVSGAWMPWRTVGTDPATLSDNGQMHTVHRSIFRRRRGGVIGTAGKPVVALRWDHGLVNFRDKVLPHQIRLGLPGSMAMNSATNRWQLPESSGVTPAQLDMICREHGIEVWNHSQTHGAAETARSLEREIATGKSELQALVPSVPVEGFMIPGVPSGNYMGFSAGESAERWDTVAGRLILGNHAVSSSHMPGTDQPLTGDQPILSRQLSIDAMSGNDVIRAVDQAVARTAGLILFLHPSQLDVAGRITTAHYVLVLEHLAALRDAGQLEILTMGGLSVADVTSAYRHNLIVDGDFTQGTEQWGSPAGWSPSAQGGVSTAGQTALTQTIDLTGREWLKGAPYDLVFRVRERNASALTVNLSIGDKTVERTIEAGVTDWTDLHVERIIPLNSANTQTVSINRVSGGYIHVESIRWVTC